MIFPVFFPFTHITEHQLKTVSAFFPVLSYLPLCHEKEDLPHIKKAVEDGMIKRLLLPPKTLDAAKQSALQYTQWAKIHKGNEHNLKAIIKDSAYFTSDTHVTTIKSQIKGKSVDRTVPSDSDLEKNLLFLTMAQMCDQQNEQIDVKLKAVGKNREKLIAALRGSEDSLEEIPENFSLTDNDTGLIMTRERVTSWAGCMAFSKGDDQEKETPFLVTTSPAVMDYFESNYTDVVNALDIDLIKVHENNCKMKTQWQHQFCELLMQAVHGEGIREKDLPQVIDGCQVSGQIKLRVFPGDLINELLTIPGKQIVICLVSLK